MMRRDDILPPRRRNQRVSTKGQRRQQHLLDVKVRSRKANEQRNRKLLSWFCILVIIATTIFGVVYGVREGIRRFVMENPDYRIAEVRIDTDGALTREEVL